MSEKQQVAIQTTIAPVEGKDLIVIGFSNEVFSQAIYVPFTSVEDASLVGEAFRDGIMKAAREIQRRNVGLVIAADIPDGLKKRRG